MRNAKNLQKFSGLLNLLFDLSKKDDNIEKIIDPVYGSISEVGRELIIINVLVKKLPTIKEFESYLLTHKIPFDKVYDGGISPGVGFIYNSSNPRESIFVSFYHPREHYY